MLDFEYAEQFHCHPQDVRKVVTVRWWTRWKVRALARQARQAHARAKASDDWVTDLTSADRAAMDWTKDDGELSD